MYTHMSVGGRGWGLVLGTRVPLPWITWSGSETMQQIITLLTNEINQFINVSTCFLYTQICLKQHKLSVIQNPNTNVTYGYQYHHFFVCWTTQQQNSDWICHNSHQNTYRSFSIPCISELQAVFVVLMPPFTVCVATSDVILVEPPFETCNTVHM